MKIETSTTAPTELRGRPRTYPFNDLQPGQKLVIQIEINDDDDKTPEDQRRKIGQAIYQFKKSNKLKWGTATRIENGTICVYRIF